jgi:hypothetical protein
LGPFTSYEENKVLPIFYVKGINHKICFNKFFSHPTNEVTVDVRQILQNILQLQFMNGPKELERLSLASLPSRV